MQKRGLSAVITSLIMILLVLVAIGVVWVVVKNTIYDETEQVSLSPLTVDIEVEGIKDNGDTIDVRVRRNVGKGGIEGLKFIVSDGVNSEIFEEPANLKELGEKTFTLNYGGLVKEVSVAPIIKTESGKASAGNIADTLKLSNKEILKNLGAVSWWRFNGNANDEIGGNHGTLGGGVDCSAEGKYGRACSFDGINDYVNAGGNTNLRITGDLSLEAWVKTSDDEGDIILKWTALGDQRSYAMFLSGGRIYGYASDNGANIASIFSSSAINDGNWHHAVFVHENGIGLKMYLDGAEATTPISHTTGIYDSGTSSFLEIGGGGIAGMYNGVIDEARIYNKALTPEEINALYNLEFN